MPTGGGDRPPAERLRVAELVGVLSLASDLGMGQPMEHGLRTCLLALSLGRALDLPEATLAEVYYVALLRWVGCTANAHDTAQLFGDDIGDRAELLARNPDTARAMLGFLVGHVGRGQGPLGRARRVAGVFAAGPRAAERLAAAHCEVAQGLAGQLDLEPGVVAALGRVFERWDGRGAPVGLAGEQIPLSARIAILAGDTEIMVRVGGLDAAGELLARRAGRAYDPALVDLLTEHAADWFTELDAASVWEAALAVEPGVPRELVRDRLDRGFAAVAHFTDLKSPHTVGHSAAVADLAARAARDAGWPEHQVTIIRRAGLVHDLGRVGVSDAIWDKPGPLTSGDWEQVRLHPYYTERALRRSAALAEVAGVAAAHHERLDGSGYPHQQPAIVLTPLARVLAAADVYCALTETRPHRPARTAQQAVRELRGEVRAGRLDAAAVDAVLRAAGHRAARRSTGPAGLTGREVEVLRLLAQGLTNRQIAARLTVSVKTVGRHVEHVYAKAAVSTRAGATLFALRHGLLDERGEP